jgi:hypothetical protein
VEWGGEEITLPRAAVALLSDWNVIQNWSAVNASTILYLITQTVPTKGKAPLAPINITTAYLSEQDRDAASFTEYLLPLILVAAIVGPILAACILFAVFLRHPYRFVQQRMGDEHRREHASNTPGVELGEVVQK